MAFYTELTQTLKQLILDEISEIYKYDLEQLMSGGKIAKQKYKRLRKEILRILDNRNTKSEKLVQLRIKKKI